jgi:prolyl oligopeptidase
MRIFLALLVSCSVALAGVLHYPEAEKGSVTDDYHGLKVADPYRWLEELDSPQTAAWVKAQKEITSEHLQGLPSRNHFKERLTKFWNFERYSTPVWRGGRYLFRKNDGLQNQSVVYTVKKLEEEPIVVLDPNKMSPDGTVALTDLELSDNGSLLAYSSAISGSDWTTIRVRDLTTGQDLPDLVKWVKFSEPSWTNDNRGFFYARFPAPDSKENQTFAVLKDQKLYYHRLGDSPEDDKLIFERPDQPEWFLSGAVSENGRYLLISLERNTERKNQLYVKDLKSAEHPDIEAPLVPLIDKFEADYRPLGVVGTDLYVLTDKDAPKYRVIRTDLSQVAHADWAEVVGETKDLLEQAEIVGGKLILKYLVDAKNELKVASLAGRAEREIPLPTLGSVSAISGNEVKPEFFYSFTSFLYPPTIYRSDVNTAQNEVFRKPNLDFSPDSFETDQIFYHSKDGTSVPMFLVKRKGAPRDGKNSVYLTGYGGFDISIVPSFSVSTLCWIEKGGIFVVPNLRGGGEYGRAWHEAGIKEHKQNVFDDFFAAAETLIKEKYSEPDRIGIVGASNGGLLIGAALTQRPELFGAAVPEVGVLDMLRYHKFTVGRAWASDYGTADDPEAFRYLFRYSPLHNVKLGVCYPPTLIMTADHDDRVFPAHSFKFAAALQAAQSCANPILIRIETKAGHGSGKPLAKVIDEQADVLAFLWDNLNPTQGTAGPNRGYVQRNGAPVFCPEGTPGLSLGFYTPGKPSPCGLP